MNITLWLQGTWLYEILYNALIALSHIGPAGSIGIAVIALTIIVRIILAPFSYKAIVHQVIQKKLEPERKRLQELYKDNKQEQAKKIMELMRENKTNPFSSCILTLIQIPIIFALYAVFLTGLSIQPDILYSFVQAPAVLNLHFLGMDLGAKSIVLGLITGLVQFLQVKFSPVMQDYTPKNGVATQEENQDTQGQIMQSMQKSMRFTLPIMITIFAIMVPAAVALYWVTSNVFTIGQELLVKRRLARDEKIV